MDPFLFLAAAFTGGMVYKLMQPYRFMVFQNLEGNHSRVANQPVPSDIARQAGNDLFRSGHPDEVVMNQNLKVRNLSQVQSKTAKDLQKNNTLMTSDHFNNQLKKRQTYASVSADIGHPSTNMGSGWYVKTVNQIKKNQPVYIRQ